MLEKHILQSSYYYFVLGNAAMRSVISNIDAGTVCTEFILRGIFLFVVGGQGGYMFNRNRLMKNKFIFSGWSGGLVDRCLTLNIFACQQSPPSTGKDVNLYRC